MQYKNNEQRRADIFDRVRQAQAVHDPVPLPDVPEFPFPGDVVENFVKSLISYGGVPVQVATRQDALKWLADNVKTDGKERVFSAIPDFKGNITVDDFPRPADANIVDKSVFESTCGVAETGSVWATDRDTIMPPAVLFSSDVFVLLDKKKILPGTHAFYNTVDISGPAYGSLYSGPSATADIEAIHVTGAQGPLAVTVILYG